MDDQERLLRLSEDLDVPIQVSVARGTTRTVAERVEETHLGSAAAGDSPGSCTSWCGWGN
jgi:hypothetical protein